MHTSTTEINPELWRIHHVDSKSSSTAVRCLEIPSSSSRTYQQAGMHLRNVWTAEMVIKVVKFCLQTLTSMRDLLHTKVMNKVI